ncbi:hypothetical protein [Mycobacterium sp. 23]|uniref:hypothetical protein n=1 Tax=Mycobacterium sp. 23 TaxID=3400424 RepID=UPI003AB07BFE
MSDKNRCRPVEVDGEMIRVRGDREMDDADRAALAEVVRAAKRHLEGCTAVNADGHRCERRDDHDTHTHRLPCGCTVTWAEQTTT